MAYGNFGKPQHANEEDELPPQDDEGGQPEEKNPTQRELLNQILSGMEKMNTEWTKWRLLWLTFDVIKAIECVIIMLLSLLFLFLSFMLNIDELCLLSLTLTWLLLRFYATFHATYLHNHIVFNATFLPSYYFDIIG